MKNLKVAILIITLITFFACSKDNDSLENYQKVNIIWSSVWDTNSSSLRAFDLDQGIGVDTIYFDGCCGFKNLNYNPSTRSILLTYYENLYDVNISSHEFEYLMDVGENAELNLDSHNQVLYGINLIDSRYNIIKVDIKKNNLEIILKDFKQAAQNNYPQMHSTLDETGQKLYLSFNDSIFSFDIKRRKIDKAVKTSHIDNLEFNPVNNKLNGITYNMDLKLAAMDIYHDFYSTYSLSSNIYGYYLSATINKNTGDYIFRTGGHEILVVAQNGTIKNSYPFDGETGLCVQTTK
jgi:hypothetical protein